ncbi:MAG: hypothetical protein PHE79_09755, partial [Eubacteriales bacterium]|nr:hypothetical protein [Eubacteriales bacterium]
EEPDGGDSEDLSLNNLIRLANESYDNAVTAQQNGDWTSYGRYLKELESYLKMLAPEEPADINPQVPSDETL